MKPKDSEFLETPRTNRRNLREKERLSEDIKVKYIKELQERNRKLKIQILKINEMLEEQREKGTTKKEHKLIPNETSTEVIKKELENVYKQIKNYEKQIHSLQTKQAGGMITDKMSRLQNILKEKTAHLQKLKNELSVLTKNSLDNVKKLKNNAGKEQLENSMLKYNEEIKVLRQKVRDAENWEKKKAQNAKKQYDYIKRLQRQLIQNGVAIDEIEDLKKNNIFNQIYDKMKNGDDRDRENDGKSRVKKNQQEQIQEITVDRFMQLKNEIKLFKKLQQDYDKRLEILEKQKKNEEKQTTVAKQKLQEKQDEIRRLQEQIGELKTKIKKVNPKPYNNTKQSAQKPRQKPKASPTKLKQPANIKTITDQTHKKFDEKGQATNKGTRFTDRNIIGKTIDSKIIGVKVWTEKNSFAINGIQCIYKIGDNIKAGQQYLNKEGKKYCSQNIMELSGDDYIKLVSGHLSQGNVIEYLVFVSKNKVIGRFGMAKQVHKQFNYDIDQDQIPVCMYGSIMNTKQNKKEGSIIESLGFQVTRDKDLNRDDKYI